MRILWTCRICGYRYDPVIGDPKGGIQKNVPFEELPDDWLCPICGASTSYFVKLEDK
ncbi:MAG: rubredoxin [Candidatus Hodarchaeales archaeon]